jgi:hypothetical protein
MAKSHKRNRELRLLEEDVRESTRRSYELIQKSEKLVLQSRDLLRSYISQRSHQSQILEPKK